MNWRKLGHLDLEQNSQRLNFKACMVEYREKKSFTWLQNELHLA